VSFGDPGFYWVVMKAPNRTEGDTGSDRRQVDALSFDRLFHKHLEADVEAYAGLKSRGVVQDGQVVLAEIGREEEDLTELGAETEVG